MKIYHQNPYDPKGSFMDCPPTEFPYWRRNDFPKTTEMIKDIVDAIPHLQNLPDSVLKTLSILYVLDSNEKELVGTSDMQSTIEIIEGITSDDPDVQGKETINTFRALQYLYDHQQQMFNVHEDTAEKPMIGLLTVDTILETHRNVLANIRLQRDAGQFRGTETRTMTDKGFMYYMKAECVPSAVQCIVDQHNYLLDKHLTQPSTRPMQLFNLISYVMLVFLTIHPFPDGNGRVARLIVQYIMRIMLPFPVRATPPYVSRTQYLDAIQIARHVDVRGNFHLSHPCDLTAMIIEGVWFSVKDAFRMISQMNGSNMRGYMYINGPDVSYDRYRLLRNMNITTNEEEQEMKLLNSTAHELWNSSHDKKKVVPLLKDSTCIMMRAEGYFTF